MRLSANFIFIIFCLCLAAPAANAQEITLNRVVAVVNGDPITLHEVELQSLPEFARNKVNPNDPANKEKVDEILKASLDEMIIDKLISQDAERLGITTTDADVDAEIANEALRLAMHKLPLKCKVVKKETQKGGESDEG